jgi:hypothetical protein
MVAVCDPIEDTGTGSVALKRHHAAALFLGGAWTALPKEDSFNWIKDFSTWLEYEEYQGSGKWQCVKISKYFEDKDPDHCYKFPGEQVGPLAEYAGLNNELA